MILVSAVAFLGFLCCCQARDLDPSDDSDWITKTWMSPPVNPVVKIYLFNLTNKEEFLAGAKPELQEVGPYVYLQSWVKTNVEWLEDDGEIEYDQEKVYKFEPSQSNGRQTDTIVMPNVPLISAINTRKTSHPFLQKALGSILEILEQDPIVTLTVREAIWGYSNPLLKLGSDILPQEKKYPFEQFGLLVGRNGTSAGKLRAFTAIGHREKVGQITQFNKSPLLNFWADDQCNKVQGSDGFVFPPNIERSDTLYLFNRDFCRSIPLVFSKEVIDSNGLEGFRFVPPDNIFAPANENPENSCFCLETEGCSVPKGLFNMSVCQFGSPILMSWPHFLNADPSLLEAVNGLSPDPEKHQLYFDIQPKVGNGLGGSVRSQINIAIEAADDIPIAKGLRTMVWPLMWFANEILEVKDQEYLDRIKALIMSD